jgi:hypothetical protein
MATIEWRPEVNAITTPQSYGAPVPVFVKIVVAKIMQRILTLGVPAPRSQHPRSSVHFPELLPGPPDRSVLLGLFPQFHLCELYSNFGSIGYQKAFFVELI